MRLRNEVFTDPARDLIVYLATPPAIFAPICQSLWAVGLVSSYTMGGLIHILLVVAIVVVLLRIIQGRRL